MKTLAILILSFVLSNGILGQEKYLDTFPLKNGKVTYSEIVQTEGIAKGELYKRAQRWLANNCEIIKLDDKDLIVGRGVFIMKPPILSNFNQIYVWQIITIQFKDGRYKYDISDFRIKAYVVSNGESALIDEPIENHHIHMVTDNQIKMIDPQVKDLILSLDKAMKTPIDDNW